MTKTQWEAFLQLQKDILVQLKMLTDRQCTLDEAHFDAKYTLKSCVTNDEDRPSWLKDPY